MLIDVSDVSTIPVEIKNKIFHSFSVLPNNIVDKIKRQDVQFNNDILCAIGDYYGTFEFTYFFDELISVLEKYDIVCYHATKVSSKSLLLIEGLKTNDLDVYCSNIKRAYLDADFPEDKIQEAIDIIKREYSRKYISQKAQLCFFNNLSMLEGEYATYGKFCGGIGGELARWALKDKYPELYRPLKENGKGYIVKFRLPFSMLTDYEKGDMAYEFVIYYAGLYFWNKVFDIKFNGNTHFDVPPENILDIMDYDKEINY